jgi:hypothetical protein
LGGAVSTHTRCRKGSSHCCCRSNTVAVGQPQLQQGKHLPSRQLCSLAEGAYGGSSFYRWWVSKALMQCSGISGLRGMAPPQCNAMQTEYDTRAVTKNLLRCTPPGCNTAATNNPSPTHSLILLNSNAHSRVQRRQHEDNCVMTAPEKVSGGGGATNS